MNIIFVCKNLITYLKIIFKSYLNLASHMDLKKLTKITGGCPEGEFHTSRNARTWLKYRCPVKARTVIFRVSLRKANLSLAVSTSSPTFIYIRQRVRRARTVDFHTKFDRRSVVRKRIFSTFQRIYFFLTARFNIVKLENDLLKK